MFVEWMQQWNVPHIDFTKNIEPQLNYISFEVYVKYHFVLINW